MTASSQPGAAEPTAAHPYSPAVVAGGMVYVSGALSIDELGKAVPGSRPALEAAVARMTERLAVAGAELTDVVKLTYFVTDVAIRDEANAHFAEMFSTPRPARTFVEVSGLPYGASVEIDAVARAR